VPPPLSRYLVHCGDMEHEGVKRQMAPELQALLAAQEFSKVQEVRETACSCVSLLVATMVQHGAEEAPAGGAGGAQLSCRHAGCKGV